MAQTAENTAELYIEPKLYTKDLDKALNDLTTKAEKLEEALSKGYTGKEQARLTREYAALKGEIKQLTNIMSGYGVTSNNVASTTNKHVETTKKLTTALNMLGGDLGKAKARQKALNDELDRYISLQSKSARVAITGRQTTTITDRNRERQESEAILGDMRDYYQNLERLDKEAANKAAAISNAKFKRELANIRRRERAEQEAADKRKSLREGALSFLPKEDKLIRENTKNIALLDKAYKEGVISKREYTSASKNLESSYNKQVTGLKKLTEASKSSTAATKDHQSSWHRHMTYMESAGVVARYGIISQALYGIQNAMTQMVRASIVFDNALYNNMAVLGATKEEAIALAKAGREIVKEFGGTVEEVDKVTLTLGRAGVALRDLAQATKLVSQLTTITGDTLEDTSKVVSTFRVNFQKVFEETPEGIREVSISVEELGNKIAYMANESKMSTQDLGTFSNYGLQTAKNLNLTVDAVGALATTMSNLGINASTIGTQMQKLEFMFNGSQESIKGFWDILKATGKTTLTQAEALKELRKGGEAGEKAFMDWAKAVAQLDFDDFQKATQGMEIRTKNLLLAIRNGFPTLEKHISKIKDAANVSTQAGIAALSASRLWERSVAQINSALDGLVSAGLDSIFDRQAIEDTQRALEGYRDELENLAEGSEEYINKRQQLIDKEQELTQLVKTANVQFNNFLDNVINGAAELAKTTIAFGSVWAAFKVGGAIFAGVQAFYKFVHSMQKTSLALAAGEAILSQKNLVAMGVAVAGTGAAYLFLDDILETVNEKLDNALTKQKEMSVEANKPTTSTEDVEARITRLLKSKEVLEKLVTTSGNPDQYRNQLKLLDKELESLIENYKGLKQEDWLKYEQDKLGKATKDYELYLKKSEKHNQEMTLAIAKAKAEGKELSKLEILNKQLAVARTAYAEAKLLTIGTDREQAEYQSLLKIYRIRGQINDELKKENSDSELSTRERLISQLNKYNSLLDGSTFSRIQELQLIEASAEATIQNMDGTEDINDGLKNAVSLLKAQYAVKQELQKLEERTIKNNSRALELIHQQNIAILQKPTSNLPTGTLTSDLGAEDSSLRVANEEYKLIQAQIAGKQRLLALEYERIWAMENGAAKEQALSQARLSEEQIRLQQLNANNALEQANLDNYNNKFQLRLDYETQSFENLSNLATTFSSQNESVDNVVNTLGSIVGVVGDINKSDKKRDKQQKDINKKYNDQLKSAEKFGGIKKIEANREKELNELKSDSFEDDMANIGALAGAAKGFFEEKTAAYKILQSIEMAMHIARMAQMAMELPAILGLTAAKGAEATANAAASITAAGSGDPYTAPARVAVMIGLMGAALAMIGGSTGGASTPMSADGSMTLEQRTDQIEADYEPMTNRLDRQIELLESIDRNGSAGALRVENAALQFERDYKLLVEESLAGTTRSAERKHGDADGWDFDKIASTYEDIYEKELGFNIADVSQNAITVDKSSLSRGFNMMEWLSSMADKGSSSLDDMSWVFNQGWGGSGMGPGEYGKQQMALVIDDFQQLLSDFTMGVVDSIHELKDAGESFKDAYDGITGSMYYESKRLDEAFSDIEKITAKSEFFKGFDLSRFSGEAKNVERARIQAMFDALPESEIKKLSEQTSFSEYLKGEIESIDALSDFFTGETFDLLVSQDPAKLSKQLEKVRELEEKTGLTFEGGSREALNYLESIELVSEAMITSRDNIDSWRQRNETAGETLQRLAEAAGQPIATMETLDNLFYKLAQDTDGLTDAELELLEAHEAYYDTLESVEDQVLSLADATDAVESDILSQYNAQMDLVQAFAQVTSSVQSFIAQLQHVPITFSQIGSSIAAISSDIASLNSESHVDDFSDLDKAIQALYAESTKAVSEEFNARRSAATEAAKSASAAAQASKDELAARIKILEVEEGILESYKDFANSLRLEQLKEDFDTNTLKQLMNDAFNTTATTLDADDAAQAISYATEYLGTLSQTAATSQEYGYERAVTAAKFETFEGTGQVATLDDLRDSFDNMNTNITASLDSLNAQEQAALSRLKTDFINVSYELLEQLEKYKPDMNEIIGELREKTIQHLGANSDIVKWLDSIDTSADEQLTYEQWVTKIQTEQAYAQLVAVDATTNAVNNTTSAVVQNTATLAAAIGAIHIPAPTTTVIKTYINAEDRPADTISSDLPGYSSGGYTGDIGTDKVAGVVHGKEYVVNADTTKDLGLNNSVGLFGEMLNELRASRREGELLRQEISDVKQLQIKQTTNSMKQLDTQRGILDEAVKQNEA